MNQDNDKAYYAWHVSQNGREWVFVGTTEMFVLAIYISMPIQQQYPYLKIEKVKVEGNQVIVLEEVRNTFKEATQKRELEEAKEDLDKDFKTKKEIEQLNQIYYKGNDNTH